MTIDTNNNRRVEQIQQIRIEFLLRVLQKQTETINYSDILQFLIKPSNYLDPKSKQIDFDRKLDEIKKLSDEDLTKVTLTLLHHCYCENPEYFGELYRDGQYTIWDHVLKCAEKLVAIEEAVQQIKYSPKKDNYPNSCEVVKRYLSLLAQSYKELTLLERTLGVERYLAVTGLKTDIEILHDSLRRIRNLCNDRLEETIMEFQLKWNISSIAKIIKKLLGNEIPENSITNSFGSHQERIIFLLLDGFGYTQYLWHLSGLRERKSATYSMNLFEWLSQFDEFDDKRILASTLVTDTGSAISTIFSGEVPSSNGIFASRIFNGSRLVNVKRSRNNDILTVAKKYPNTFLSDLSGVQICIFDGAGGYDDDSVASFSELIYSNFDRIPTSPSDRIFLKILGAIDISQKKQLLIGYLPLIDSTGHAIGSFTSFESYEYEKLNILLVDFLLNLAYAKKELFDNNTTLVITADHGMFETSNKKISKEELIKIFIDNNLPAPFIVIDNRAILFYKISNNNIAQSKQVMEDYLKRKEIVGKILIGTDILVQTLWDSHNSNCPKMVLLFKGDGIGIFHEMEEKMLHHGGHGGCSCEEVFVPFITITLSPNLHEQLINHFAKLK